MSLGVQTFYSGESWRAPIILRPGIDESSIALGRQKLLNVLPANSLGFSKPRGRAKQEQWDEQDFPLLLEGSEGVEASKLQTY